jgi:hypothetical protein
MFFMVFLFLGNIDVPGIIILSLPIALVTFVLSRRFFKRRFQSGRKVILWTILATFVLTPILFILLIVLIVVGFSVYDKFQVVTDSVEPGR